MLPSENPRQTGDSKALQQLGVGVGVGECLHRFGFESLEKGQPQGKDQQIGPAARGASTDTDIDLPVFVQGATRHRQRQARSAAFASLAIDKPIATATELWSPQAAVGRRRRSFRATTSNNNNNNSSPSSATAHLDESAVFDTTDPPPLSPGARAAAATTANMMEVNVVPSVVLHFHGFRSSLLSNLWDACCRILLDMIKRSALFTCGCVVATVVCYSVVQVVMCLTALLLQAVLLVLQRMGFAAITMGAFLAFEAIAVIVANKSSELLHHSNQQQQKQLNAAVTTSATMTSSAVPTLPKLNVPSSIVVLPEKADQQTAAHQQKQREFHRSQATATATDAVTTTTLPPQPPRQLSAVRRRVVAQLRDGTPFGRAVAGERRCRMDVCLKKATIRVGKAYVDPVTRLTDPFKGSKPRPQDIYMVRVDCSTPNDKHMNPVVMWDFTATFDEFRKLEKELRKEIKTKKLRSVSVPHLWSGAILFLEPELTQDVLHARRDRLQKFVDRLRDDAVLVNLDAMRKFCQAF